LDAWKNRAQKAVQLMIDGSKCFTKFVQVVQEAKVLEGFEDLSRKCKRSKNAKRGE
jgi:hypothetical protein